MHLGLRNYWTHQKPYLRFPYKKYAKNSVKHSRHLANQPKSHDCTLRLQTSSSAHPHVLRRHGCGYRCLGGWVLRNSRPPDSGQMPLEETKEQIHEHKWEDQWPWDRLGRLLNMQGLHCPVVCPMQTQYPSSGLVTREDIFNVIGQIWCGNFFTTWVQGYQINTREHKSQCFIRSAGRGSAICKGQGSPGRLTFTDRTR